MSSIANQEPITELQEKGCQTLLQAGFQPKPVDSVTFLGSRVQEVAYVPMMAANAIAILAAADIPITHTYISYGRPMRILPPTTTDVERQGIITLMVFLAPVALIYLTFRIIYIAIYQSVIFSPSCVVELSDSSLLEICKWNQ
jgi:hypothetical protein